MKYQTQTRPLSDSLSKPPGEKLMETSDKGGSRCHHLDPQAKSDICRWGSRHGVPINGGDPINILEGPGSSQDSRL